MFGTTKTQLAFEPTIKDVIRKKINNSFYSHFIVEALNLKSNYTEETISIKVVDDYATKKTPTYTNFEQIPYTTTQTSGYFPFGFWEEQEEFSYISHWEQINELIEQLSSNQEIEIVNYLFSRIQRLFVNEKEFMLYRDLELLSKLSRPAKDILNEKLGLIKMKYENKPLINGLISSNKSEKLYFLTFLLEQPDIEIDLSLKDNDQHTALYEALHLYNYNSHYIIELLFIRGYKVSNEEENRLYEEFDNPSTRPELLENITIAILCLKLGREDLIKKLPKIERIILGLISFKVNRVIGYRLNLTALANVFLQSHRDFSTIFIRALKIYGHYDTLKIKTSIAKKLEIIKDEMPYQETSFNDLLSIVFPELYSEH